MLQLHRAWFMIAQRLIHPLLCLLAPRERIEC